MAFDLSREAHLVRSRYQSEEVWAGRAGHVGRRSCSYDSGVHLRAEAPLGQHWDSMSMDANAYHDYPMMDLKKLAGECELPKN